MTFHVGPALLVALVLSVNGIEFGAAQETLRGVAADVAIEAPAATQAKSDSDDITITWHDAHDLTVEGQGWTDTQSAFDRLPIKAKGKVRDAVWGLSRHSAGIAVRFVTDATDLHARWSLTSAQLAMPHMAATGVSGLDLYVRDANDPWRWLACAQPKQQTNTWQLIAGLPAGRRTYMIYLPLYNGVKTLEIGVPNEATLSAAPPRAQDRQQPIVFYGTSITQGACASRPGMPHTALLGRRFDRPVINLGFSGNGRMEPEVAELVAELDASLFVIDCLPNLSAQQVQARTEPCVKIIREAHPQTPILLVEDRTYGDAFLLSRRREANHANRLALRSVYQELKAAGDQHLYYLEGAHLLGDDNEGTVDSSHPNDVGFMRQADAMAKVFEQIFVSSAE